MVQLWFDGDQVARGQQPKAGPRAAQATYKPPCFPTNAVSNFTLLLYSLLVLRRSLKIAVEISQKLDKLIITN